ncbi:MAG: HYR domain-containing protein, partial [Paludibacteraceae bacterium]|nr:HYR domain-containing protein [Paludibacteraceae bacterium]
MSVQGQTITSVQSACENDPVFLSVSGYNPTDKIQWWISDNGTTWEGFGNITIAVTKDGEGTSSIVLQKMPANDIWVTTSVYGRPANGDYKRQIKLNTTNCQNTVCRTTTTGDYFQGTDFDHDGPVNWNTTPPENLVQFFSDNNVKFQGKSGQLVNQEYLGVPLYIDDSLGVNPNNNFYVKKGAVNESFFSIKFPNDLYRGKSYCFTMRFYLIVPKGCNWDRNASLMSRTGHGRVTADTMDVDIYYEYDQGRKSDSVISKLVPMGSDVARYKFYRDIEQTIADHARDADRYDIFRFEMVYYGYMPTYTNADYDFQPFFEQFPQCPGTMLAVDYISAEAATVCVDPRSACVGDSITVNTSGFPRNANYKWTKYSDGTYKTPVAWSAGEVSFEKDKFGQDQKATIAMKSEGDFYYRVSDGTNSKNFKLTGEDCGAVACPTVTGADKVCLPTTGATEQYTLPDSDVLKWEVANGGVNYQWSLLDPSGADKSIYVSPAAGGLSATAKFPGNAMTSDATNKPYKMIVVARRALSNEKICSDSLLIMVNKTPDLTGASLDLNDNSTKLCASTLNGMKVSINPAQLYENIKGYTIQWTGAESDVNLREADLIVNQARACAGADTEYSVGIKVINPKNTSCFSTLEKTFPVIAPEEPTIKCLVLDPSQTNLELGPKQSTLDYTVPDFGAVTVACGTPTKTIVSKNADGTSSNVVPGDVVKLPAGTSLFIYTVKDGCDKTASCTITVVVSDANPPLIDCGLIEDSVAYLSKFSGCAVVYPSIKAPVLNDLNGVDGTITGRYLGRKQGGDTQDSTKYNKTIGLLDEYPVGNTYILWGFSDKSGNTSVCSQKVTVIDDLKPTLSCPSVGPLNFGADKDLCELSWAHLEDSLETALAGKYPSAVIPCPLPSQNPTLTPTVLIDRGTGFANNYSALSSGSSYRIAFVFYKSANGDTILATTDTCFVTVNISDKQSPALSCENWTEGKNKTLTVTSATACSYKYTLVTPPAAIIKDNCSATSALTYVYSVDGAAEITFVAGSTVDLQVGKHTITWKIKDELGNVSESCDQTIIVNDDKPFTVDCPDEESTILEDCGDLTWNAVNTRIKAKGLVVNATYINCTTNLGVDVMPSFSYKEKSEADGAYKNLLSNSPFYNGKTYTVRMKYVKEGDYINTKEAFCYLDVLVADTTKIEFKCDDIKPLVLDVVNSCDTLYKLPMPKETTVSDNCSSYENYTFYYSLNGGSFVKYVPNTSAEALHVGNHELVWKVADASGNEANNTCAQEITVKDNRKFEATCTTAESYSVESCTNMEWVDVKAALPSEAIAKASYTDCNSSVVVNVAPTMYYKRTTETTYTPLTLTSIFENGVTYDIQWHFVKSGLYMTGQDFDCYSQITVKDKSAPVIHCSEIEKVTLTVDNGCSLDYQPKAPFVAFVDVCVKSEELTYFYKLEDATTFTELTASSSLNLTVGSHTLTWKASDKAGNESQTCDQIIEVNDNRRMDLSCPESDGTFIVETCGDLDGQSVQDSLKKLNKFATAKYTECNTNNEVKLTPVVEYALKGSTAWNPMNASATFKYNTEYTVRWTFTKSGEHIVSQTEKCELDILLKDTTAPVFDCKNLADLAVLININREQQLEKYASAKGQTTQNPKTTYTLKDRLKIPSASDVYDNCSSSQVKVTVEVTGPINEAGQISTTSIADLDALEKHKFYIGEHTIHFKFTDNTGNESVCEQKITVLEKFKPIPNCSSFDDLVTTLNADANCSAKLEMTTSDVPTANMSYWYEVKYKNYENYSAPIVLVNDSAEFAQLPSRNSLTVPKSVTGYPYKLVKVLNVDADLNMTSKSEVSMLNNTYNSQDTINAKYVQHRFYPSTGGEEIKLYQHFDDDAHPTRIKRTNFASLPEDLLVFPKGTHKLVWHFVNNIGEEDSCETKIEVLDKTNPTITCPVDEELSTSAESQNCNVSYTLDAANVSVSDNCPAEFKYQYKIDEEAAVAYSGAIDVTLSVGSHIITWIVFDEAGNSAECSYNVTVKDETKPEFDCPAAEVLTTEPNSKVCEVPFNKSAASLNAQDNCSTELVYSYKIDDKDEVIFTDQLNVNLPVGEHILTWLVKDEAGNVSSCTQKVTVKDVTLPVFDCDNINPFTVRDTLEGSDCEAPFSSIQFNEYIAEDNCSSIKGILSRTQDLSGEIAADEKFKAGVLYDLYWLFQDTSGNKVTCDQKVELFSQNKPSFNCDSLKEAVITEVLQSRCEIPAAELNVNTPHAVDVCTGAVIQGVGRRTSGRAMADIYPVGRDTIVWVFDSPYSSEIDSCEQYVFIQSDKDLKFDCDSLNKAVIDTVLHAICDIEAADLKVNRPFALDACTNDSIWGVGVRTSGKAMTDACPVGRDTINWTFISEFSTDTVVCQQFVFIQSDNAPIFNCDSLNNAVIDTTLHGVCEISAVDLNVNTPFALDACTNDTIWGVGIRTSGKAMTEAYPVGRDTIVWIFDSEYSTNTDTCKQFVYIKSDKDLIFDCDSLNNAPVDTVLHDVCEISSADLAINTPFAIDACTSDTIWGVGQRSSGKDMTDVYPVGRDTITWTFISEYTTDTVTCEQFVYVKSDKDLIFDCDSLNNAPIHTVLNGVCEISAADLKVNTPFALDACTKDTIWGVGVRTSGKLLTDAYPVGRDTINWTFISEFSTDTVVCQQFVYIQSDIEPIFDCDSLNKAVIDTTLDGVCEISATDLNVNRPFALDACTNDTIWGVGTRTSGRAMTEKYIVGRDTINWTFISEFSTDTVVCQQFVYIKSSSDLIFDCYSLNEEVIDTVLHDVCEISAADLNIDTPYALDACTKDTIWGIGTRTSGRAMTEKYIVGRDTITWTFISAYSTDTVICQQFVYIKSDKDLIFDCDSLNNAPVDTVLHDVCEISSADLAINTPFAIDPCTIDTIWGVGQRSSGKDMTDVYPVGRDTITWTFISEYTTDTVTCEQFVYVKSDKDLIFDCDSLNNAPIDTVLNGVCEISAADLKVNTPFALDACTKDTIWGVGARTSGKAMTDPYPVGRDTINWTFISDFSTDTVICQQFVYIQSDNEPIFDCDSLNNAVIDTTLHGVCEISATDLNVNTPFALDACTNDTIFGVGTRTSGKTMTEVYPVGRDTIVWVFDSEYSTNTDTCRQFVYIKSDIAPVFNCDSLNNAVIDTVLHDACVISAADLNVNTPFALDACTKDTVWGVGTRTSGKLLTDDYPVGGDTIVWVFNSEFSTTIDSCEQFVYIKSDKELKFNCDTLKPIVLNPTGCDTIMPLGSISVPYALDACTNDTIWGVGKRLDKESLDLYTEPYSVGQTYIEWTFTSQYSTIVDTCRQLVDVRTLDSLIFACSDINPDTIKVEVKTGECAVSIDDVPMGSYQAQNPCTNEMVDGIAMVGDKRFSELDSLAVGVTLVTWVFTDMSSTLKDSVVKCEQYIQIGDVNKMPVDCRTFEDQSITRTLDEGNCTLDYVELDIHHDEVRDLCTNKIIEPYISRYNVIIADSVNYADPYKVGQDTLYWKYVFRGQEVVCKQVVTINDNYTPNFDCSTLNPLIVDAEKGSCSVEAAKIGLEEHFATDSCNIDLKIQGTGTRSDSLSLAADYPVGRTIITWTFTNMYSDSTVSKICEQIVDVIGDNKTQIACDSLLPIKGNAFAGDCTIDPQRLGIEIPVAVDSCIADLFIPGIGIRSDSTAESPKSLLNDVYPIGETSITWTFVSPYSHEIATCVQYVQVKDSIEPTFDCTTLDTIRLASEPAECFALLDSVKARLTQPVAVDSCTNKEIEGVVSAWDGSELPEKYAVGDTVSLKWTFIDSTINNLAKVCEQVVLVTGDQKPKVNCDSLWSHPIEKTIHDTCEVNLEMADIPVPFALDACTNDTIKGEGQRLDGSALTGVYPVGKTTIRWTFVSPFSSDSAVCEQYIHIKTDLQIDVNCDTISSDTVKVTVEEGKCFVNTDLIPLKTPLAFNVCTGDTLRGVATVPDMDNIPYEQLDSLHTGLIHIVWTFKDTTSTLVDSVATCDQYIKVGDSNELPVKCDSIKPITISLKDNCVIPYEELNISVPDVIDLCTNELIIPDTIRYSVVDSLNVPIHAPYTVGQDTLFWSYKFGAQVFVCKQVITLLSTGAPQFDCDQLDSIAVTAKSGSCTVPAVELNLPNPIATDTCNEKIKIPGTPVRSDSLDLLAEYPVGRTLITWTFTSMYSDSAVSKVCKQIVEVMGDNDLIFDCDSLQNNPIEKTLHDTCEVQLTSVDIITPFAIDSCTLDTIYGQGRRLDEGELYGTYQTGKTYIEWVFNSEWNTKADTCVQLVHLLSDKELIFNCDSLQKDTMHISVADGVCDTVLSVVTPYAVNPCTGDSIEGVPSRSDNMPLDSAYSIGLTVITWTFTDKSETLVDSVRVCEQYIQVGDNNQLPVDCNDIKDTTIILDDVCEIAPGTLNLMAPMMVDWCSKQLISPDTARTSGRAMTDVYPLGQDTVIWTYKVRNQRYVCDQVVTVMS